MGGAGLWEEGEEFSEDEEVEEEEAGPSNTSSNESEGWGPHVTCDWSVRAKRWGTDVEVETVKEEVEFEQEGAWPVYKRGGFDEEVEGAWPEVGGACACPVAVWEPRWMRWLTMMLLPKPPIEAMVVLCSRCTTAVIPPSAISRRIRARASSPDTSSGDSPELEVAALFPSAVVSGVDSSDEDCASRLSAAALVEGASVDASSAACEVLGSDSSLSVCVSAFWSCTMGV